VLSTTVFLEWSVGKLEPAVAVSLLMVLIAVIVLVLLQHLGKTDALEGTVRR
jgi:molybdate transport system permease protein